MCFRYIPIIASVSEHQPTAWPSFFMDLSMLIWVFPAGVLLCFKELHDEHVFIIIYSVFASYFAGVMVRLMLALTPVVCVAAAIALSSLLDIFVDVTEPVPEGVESPETQTSIEPAEISPTPKKSKKGEKGSNSGAPVPSKRRAFPGQHTKKYGVFGIDTRLGVVTNTVFLLLIFVLHCTWVTSNAYSSPSVVLASKGPDGSQNIIDDFREAYYWLRQNTPEDSVVMSWWDYGYQIAGFADRPTLVDNNTWNNSEYLRLFCPVILN
jgi:dolichyl-diphosphooligosaccharide---protein glycosyltransferase